MLSSWNPKVGLSPQTGLVGLEHPKNTIGKSGAKALKWGSIATFWGGRLSRPLYAGAFSTFSERLLQKGQEADRKGSMERIVRPKKTELISFWTLGKMVERRKTVTRFIHKRGAFVAGRVVWKLLDRPLRISEIDQAQGMRWLSAWELLESTCVQVLVLWIFIW